MGRGICSENKIVFNCIVDCFFYLFLFIVREIFIYFLVEVCFKIK